MSIISIVKICLYIWKYKYEIYQNTNDYIDLQKCEYVFFFNIMINEYIYMNKNECIIIYIYE